MCNTLEIPVGSADTAAVLQTGTAGVPLGESYRQSTDGCAVLAKPHTGEPCRLTWWEMEEQADFSDRDAPA